MENEAKENIKFSVSMCVYKGDNPVWFKQAVESLLAQTCLPDEIVLVVDGPVTKELEEIIADYEINPLFHIVRLAVNQGHGNARRAGLNACKNKLVALMDADDICQANRFQLQISAFEQDRELALVGGNIAEFTDCVQNIVGYRVVAQTDEEIKKDIKKRCPFNQVTVMFDKEKVEQVGGYVDWYCDEDYYLWLRMYLAGMKFCNLNAVLVNVRVGKDMYRRRGGWKYFQSEAKLQKFMKKNKIIGFGTYIINILKRFIVQVLLPNRLRGWVFKTFARKSAQTYEGQENVE